MKAKDILFVGMVSIPIFIVINMMLIPCIEDMLLSLKTKNNVLELSGKFEIVLTKDCLVKCDRLIIRK